VTLFVVAIVISSLTLKAREQAETARQSELHTLALYHLGQDLVQVIDLITLAETAIHHVGQIFQAPVAVYYKGKENFTLLSRSPDFIQNEADHLALLQSFQKNIPTGRGTPIESAARAYYTPLQTLSETVGVLAIIFKTEKVAVLKKNEQLLETFAHQISFAIERLKLLGEAQQAELLRQTEKLHTIFLNSISHDLRTPLATISGALSSLLQNSKMNRSYQQSLLETAYEESVKLNQLVGDLLNMARVESGALHITKKAVDLKDLIGTAVKQMEKVLKGHQVKIQIAAGVPEIELDYVLIMRVLKNVLDNAAKFTPADQEISIAARVIDSTIEIKIADEGIGIPAVDLEHVFDKFYRIKRPQNYPGTGLGLSVCRGIIEAHHGKIRAQNRETGGTVITIVLPLGNG
jgi:two-component system sensor histidine kinase KdpD